MSDANNSQLLYTKTGILKIRNACIVLVLAVFCLCACNNSDEASQASAKDSGGTITKNRYDSIDYTMKDMKDTVLQNKILDTLMTFSFMKESNRYIDSLSNHKHGISFMTNEDTIGHLVDVTAGYNGPERFETYYLFVVNPKTLDIKIMGSGDDYMSIEEYIKQNKKK